MRNMSRAVAPARGAAALGGTALLATPAIALASYLAYEPVAAVAAGLLALMLAGARLRLRRGLLPAREALPLIAFSGLLALAIVAGAHIHVVFDTAYAGTIRDSYIEPWTVRDALGWCLCLIGCHLLASSGYVWLTGRGSQGIRRRPPAVSARRDPVNVPVLVAVAVALFAAWLPYLVSYWPGFVFGDTAGSLSQIATGVWDNHHPVLYTAFIKCGLDLARLLGRSATAGLAATNLVQMAFMAACLAYLCCWVAAHLVRRHRLVALTVLASLFALAPYFATYAIAMWKDPVFSASVAMLSLLLADYVETGGAVARSPRWLISLALFSLLAIFFRNNGLYLVVAVALAFALLSARRATRARFARAPVVFLELAALVALSAAVQGPGYAALGIAPTEKVESLGVPLNQMARVAALDGDMSEGDRAFMAALLPLDEYAAKYRPCCTDLLKWDPDLNARVLADPAFMDRWFSMLVRNPRVYLDAWALQTFGFWDPGYQDAVARMGNIAAGVPRNNSAAYLPGVERAFGLKLRGTVSNGGPLPVPSDGASVPVGVMLWLLLYLAACLVARHRLSPALSLVPSAALLATLVIASPIWYWARYGLAVQILAPVYILQLAQLRAAAGGALHPCAGGAAPAADHGRS